MQMCEQGRSLVGFGMCVLVTYGLICSLWNQADGVSRVTTLKIQNSQRTSYELVSVSYQRPTEVAVCCEVFV